jgi:hypothetical protein
MATPPPKVFVSYSHDSDAHRDRVLALADRLRAEGIDARLDRYVENPSEGWPGWMQRQLVECDFGVLVCTPTYRRRFDREDAEEAGKGAKWEGMIAQQLLYEAHAKNDKLVPVLFEEGREDDVPLVLRPYTRYRLMGEYDRLYRRLTRQPEITAPPLGTIRTMPPASRMGLGVGGAPAAASAGPGTVAAAAITDEALVDELARVLHDEGQARLVARWAGLSPAMIPVFRVPLVFWTAVVDAARSGAMAGGVRAVAEAAVRLFPGNAVLQRYLSQ